MKIVVAIAKRFVLGLQNLDVHLGSVSREIGSIMDRVATSYCDVYCSRFLQQDHCTSLPFLPFRLGPAESGKVLGVPSRSCWCVNGNK